MAGALISTYCVGLPAVQFVLPAARRLMRRNNCFSDKSGNDKCYPLAIQGFFIAA